MSFRAVLGIGAVLVFALAAGINNLVDCVTSYDRFSRNSGKDEISAYEERFQGLKTRLPPRSVVGYVSDRNSVAEYYLTQYTLSPVLVARREDEKLIVGNFFRAYPGSEFYKEKGFVLVADHGNGVLLLRGGRN